MSADSPSSPHPKRRRTGLLKALVSAALLAVLLTQIDARAIWAALAGVKWIGVWAALALFIAGIFIRACRWQILLDDLELPVPLATLSALYFIGAFFNAVLPTGFGGDVVKAAELTQRTGRAALAVGSVVVDRFLGIVALLAMGLGALLFAGDWVGSRITWGIAVLFFACVLGYALLRQERLVRRLGMLVPQRLRQAVLKPAAELYAGLRGYSARGLAMALAASFLFNITWVGVNMLLGWSLGIEATLAQYLIFVPLVSLSLLLPSIGGLGVRELTYVGLFGQVGVPAPTAVALSLGVYSITVATGLVGGVMYLVTGIRRTRLQRQS